MKNELKISTLSIVCVLCTAMAMPSFGAPAVRSLGGAGTYSSASSAASTGSKSTSTAKSTVRGGSMRVGDAKPTTSTSTRAAASPRLSIGKYLGGVTTVGGSKPSSGGNLGQAGVEQRVTKLEEVLGLGEYDGKFGDLLIDIEQMQVDVKQLQEDLNDMTDGGYRISVEEEDGKLIISQGDKEVWSGGFASVKELEDLQDALDALTGRVSANETAIATLETGLESLKKTVDGLGDIASDDLLNRVADLESAVKGLQSGGASGETVSQLQEDVEGLSSQVESVVAQLEDVATQEQIKDFVKSDAVESMIQDLATKGEITELQTEMAKLATKDSVKDFITSDYVTQAIAGLQTAEQVSQAIDAKIANLATKGELETAKSELQAAIDNINKGQIELTNYYTKAEADAKFATKDEIPVVPTKVSEFENDAGYVKQGVLDIITASITSEVETAQSVADAAKVAADAAQNLANLNAAELDELAAVAKTGSYNDLSDKPTLITQDDLSALRTALESQIEAKADAGDYATSGALQDVSDALAELKNDSYTREEINQKIADAVSGGEIDLSDYATVAALNEAKAALEAKDTELSNGLTALTESLTDYVKKSELSPVAISGNYADLEGAPDMNQYVTTTQVDTTVSNAMNAYEIPDNSITADKIQAGAVTSDKINTGAAEGEMVMLMSNGDGTSSWVSVTVDAE
ncbi:MAG: hypothetical protein IJW84_02765 [Alphaproteobacteria bacterium]|nr:hypothetical protein [Alphaproteobacteria bacterium]